MSWEEINDTPNKMGTKERQAKAEALAKQYAICFSTECGQAVLTHLVNSFIMESDTNLASQNINYEAAYRNGEAGVIKYILNQVKRAQNL